MKLPNLRPVHTHRNSRGPRGENGENGEHSEHSGHSKSSLAGCYLPTWLAGGKSRLHALSMHALLYMTRPAGSG